jgi:hypothetical protein
MNPFIALKNTKKRAAEAALLRCTEIYQAADFFDLVAFVALLAN